MANTIQNKLAYLEQTKGLIKESIVAKGVDVADTDTFRSYADKISSIQSGGGGTVNIPDGTKFGYSTFTTVPDSIISYLGQQTDLSSMFYNCKNLQTVSLFGTNRATTMDYMFYSCSSLTTVPQFDTHNVTTMYSTFYGCVNLQTVPLLNFFNVTNVSSLFYNSMFYNCKLLTDLGGFTGLKVNLDLHYSPLLTTDSVMNVINTAADMTSSPKTLTLQQNVFNKLSQEQIATASAKGWNIASK